jgi:methyl-accepting chemotaxis protein
MIMAPSTLQTRLRFSRIDAPTIALLRHNVDFLMRELDSTLDGFYRHVEDDAEARRFFSKPDVVRHAKDMQLRHWKIILSGGFDAEYEQSVRKIGFTHYRLGLEPRLYIGGYNFTLTGLCEAIATRMPLSRFDRDAGKKRASLQTAVIRVAILDMDLSQSVYLEAMEQARRSELQKVAADLQLSIAETAASVRLTAETLQQNAHRMNETAKTTVAQAEAADAAAALTAANVNAVSAATTELSYSVSEIGQQTRRSHEIAESSAQAAKKSEEMIGQLARAAEQIGGFVGMINAIAGKTNMLALNATIEAARAGEAGRGFAVVASEVKALAEQTARATAEIGEKISAIQASTQLFAENIDLIARTTEETSAAATGIATAVEEQGAATHEITRNITEASTGVAGVAESVQAVARAADAATAASGEVLEASRQLTRQAGDLTSNMERFLQSLNAA